MSNVLDKLQRIMDAYSIRKKLFILYVCCMLLPLFVTDAVILYIVFDNEHVQQQKELESIASAVESDLTYTFDEAVNFTNSIYINRTINQFLEQSFDSPLEFFEESRKFTADPFLSNMNSDRFQVAFYGDNEDIVNGGLFFQLSPKLLDPLYLEYQNKEKDMAVIFNYKESNINVVSNRKIVLIRKLDYFKDLQKEKYAVVTIDYVNLVRRFQDMRYNAPVMICSGNRILFTNDGNFRTKIDYEYLTGSEKIHLERDFSICGEPFRILILKPEGGILPSIQRHLPLIFCLILVNVLLPLVLVLLINRSFAVRLGALSQAFDRMDTEELEELENIQGTDEISALMWNYNRMVVRLKELIQTVYKDRLEKQGIDIARQQAELLALHSQINPHFLFNVLESIRMHCILKKEDETAAMVERLALLERQNVEWDTDDTTIDQEVTFIKAYLELQKYRFGERLSYEIDIKEECRKIKIPKLALVTFVENSCVHGIEKKSVPCWIYLRVYRKGTDIIMEVEDTGEGMEEDEVVLLNHRMNHVQIDDIRKKKHVGVLNACLRLKMATRNRISFEMESEKGIGTFLMIRIPADAIGAVDADTEQKSKHGSVGGEQDLHKEQNDSEGKDTHEGIIGG